jgi:hypothetical protein
MITRIFTGYRGFWAALLAAALVAPAVQAVPSFARQTGMACEACHTVFPELTHFGRMFKANAYTVDNLKPVRGVSATKEEMLALSGLPPISLMVQVSQTSIAKAIPDGVGVSQSSSVAFPQQISLFYAGKIAPRLGAFIQLTYGNDAGSIGIDNVDLRWADNKLLPGDKSLIYGITANNNPTVQDLWNSTPAFGYPYASSNANISPLAGAQIDGALGQDVAGVSLYAMWNESLYGEIGTYRSAKQGSDNANSVTGAAGPLDGTNSNVITGGAPYYRLAYEHLWGANSLSVGVYGATFKLLPGADGPGTLSGPANEFRDTAEDLQYQYIGDPHLFTFAATHIKEKMTLNASTLDGTNLHDDLTTTRFVGTYYYQRKYGATLAMFSTTGSLDAGLYPALDITADPPANLGVVTSANGLPDTKGWVAELNYMPWLNTRISLQDTQYSKFNGGGSNYDGAGRNASDNNSLYLLVWFNY